MRLCLHQGRPPTEVCCVMVKTDPWHAAAPLTTPLMRHSCRCCCRCLRAHMQLAGALGRRLAVEYSPWSIALTGLTHVHHVFTTAALTDARWGACAAALERFITRNLAGGWAAARGSCGLPWGLLRPAVS